MKSRISKAVSTALPIFCAFASVYGQNSDQSPGYCQQQCVNQNKPVMGTTQGSNCYCGDLLPDSSDQVSSSQCNSPCNGYDQDMCGGSNAWSVQLTGLDDSVGSESDSQSNSQSSASSAPTSQPAAVQPTPSPTQKISPSVVTKASTIMVTAPGQTNAQPQETIVTTTNAPSSGGPNKAGVAAGVVIGVVAIGAIAGGTFFCLRNRKRRAIEDEYRRNLAGSYGPKPPSTAGSMSDSRLEPSVMFQRRQSDGSIADNQDYSRRILKVTNPDDS